MPQFSVHPNVEIIRMVRGPKILLTIVFIQLLGQTILWDTKRRESEPPVDGSIRESEAVDTKRRADREPTTTLGPILERTKERGGESLLWFKPQEQRRKTRYQRQGLMANWISNLVSLLCLQLDPELLVVSHHLATNYKKKRERYIERKGRRKTEIALRKYKPSVKN